MVRVQSLKLWDTGSEPQGGPKGFSNTTIVVEAVVLGESVLVSVAILKLS